PKPWLNQELSEEERWELKRKQGLTMVGLDVKIVDSSGKKLPHDGEAVGEILLRGPWVLGKYHDAPGSEDQFTEDGYFRTGDVGAIDSEGYLKLTDRTKDLIKSGGEWISSVDMENEIVNHSAVLEAAVVGLTHARRWIRGRSWNILPKDLPSGSFPTRFCLWKSSPKQV
ncbi:MAG: hypothetical protein ACXACG_18430, partial [Candidatus Thorarchaeota archaeon]